MHPKEDCQEFAKLRSGLPKFFSGNSLFTDTHKEEWALLSDQGSRYYTTADDAKWPIEELLLKKGRAAPQIVIPVEGQPVSQELRRKLDISHGVNHPKVSSCEFGHLMQKMI